MDWKLILTAFGTLFLAELGDKTQLATLLLAARTGKPLPVCRFDAVLLDGANLDWIRNAFDAA